LLADEPTSSLDDENSSLLFGMLGQINRSEKVTVIVTTTDLYEPLPTSCDYMLRTGELRKISGLRVDGGASGASSNSE
jgi:ABC-type phosphate/phosphonate transport system ATPase subunit